MNKKSEWEIHELTQLWKTATEKIKTLERQIAAIDEANSILIRNTTICMGKFVGEMDGKPVPGNIFDGTDNACQGWWRGHDTATKKYNNLFTRAQTLLTEGLHLPPTEGDYLWKIKVKEFITS